MLRGRTVVVGVTGGIACYKCCEIVSRLIKLGATVKVIMTKNATEFVRPLTFEVLSKNPVVSDMWDRNHEWEVEHVSLANSADLILIAPTTANVIGKIASGIADDMLTTTVMATSAPVLICPSMNTGMWDNPITRQNVNKLISLGYHFMDVDEGMLACGVSGKGRLAEPEKIVERAVSILTSGDYNGKKLLITAGGTREPIDGVRSITNRSSGKMGIALARNAIKRGAKVKLVVGTVSVDLPKGAEVIKVTTTDDMYREVIKNLAWADCIIKAAAPADYKVENPTTHKIKDKELTLKLVKNVDIAREVGKIKCDKKLVIFAAETDELLEYAKDKLIKKGADLVVANDVGKEGAGFECDTNEVTIMDTKGEVVNSGKRTKDEISEMILDKILTL